MLDLDLRMPAEPVGHRSGRHCPGPVEGRRATPLREDGLAANAENITLTFGDTLGQDSEARGRGYLASAFALHRLCHVRHQKEN
ncbi:hypothetical protein [Streptomyces mirabilis]|uniref:hypothetical protein n=1 Tax=Streptomyces mirabilis TaxID=68239 RepID=UPI0033B56FE1